MKKLYLLYEYPLDEGADGKEVIALSEQYDMLIGLIGTIQNKKPKEITEVISDESSGIAVERSVMLTGGALILRRYKRLFTWEGPKK